jgi:hypothetical protein
MNGINPIDLGVLETTPIAKWAYPRILVGIPLERAVSHASSVFMNFLYMATYGPAFIEAPYGRIDAVRNAYVMQLLQSDFTHLLMLDIDHIHPVDIIQRLARWTLIYPEMKVISGLNFRRGEPYDPVAGLLDENGKRMTLLDWQPGIAKVDEVGAASILVHRSVFEQMEPPWFFNIYDKVWANDFPGEDMGFCRKCGELGIPIYVDTTVSSPHMTETPITEATFKAYLAKHPEAFAKTEVSDE